MTAQQAARRIVELLRGHAIASTPQVRAAEGGLVVLWRDGLNLRMILVAPSAADDLWGAATGFWSRELRPLVEQIRDTLAQVEPAPRPARRELQQRESSVRELRRSEY